MKFKIIETRDILYVNRKIKDEFENPIDYLDVKTIILSDHQPSSFYLYDIRHMEQELNIWDRIINDISFATQKYIGHNILSYYNFYLSPNYYNYLPSHLNWKDLLKITFYAPSLQTRTYYEEIAHNSMFNILNKSSDSFTNNIMFSIGLELFEDNNDLYYALWRPMNSGSLYKNYNLRKNERFNTLMRSYLLFDDNSTISSKHDYTSDPALSKLEKAIIDAGWNKHIFDITGKQYLRALFKRKIDLFSDLKQKYGFDSFTDLDRAKLLLTNDTDSLTNIAKKAHISYPTVKRYKYNLDSLGNVPWKNIYKLSEIYRHNFNDDSSFLL